MTLSAIVFSLTFVMVQFSATAYSPRLVLWLAEDPLISHALGVFTATFLYAIAALAWVDRDNGNGVPILSAAVVVLCLVASIAMFIALVKRIALLQVNRMLTFTGDQGRRVIATVYRDCGADAPESAAHDAAAGPPTQVLAHRGRPQAIQAIDGPALVTLARGADARIDVTVAVGDTVMESTPLLRVYGGTRPIDERALRTAITLGHQRTFEQDPQYAVRLLVDIAIRALSPADQRSDDRRPGPRSDWRPPPAAGAQLPTTARCATTAGLFASSCRFQPGTTSCGWRSTKSAPTAPPACR